VVAHRFDYVGDSQQSPRLAFLKGLDDADCHRHAEIGADERFFELVPVNRFAGKLLGETFEKIHDVIPPEVENSRCITLRWPRVLRLRFAPLRMTLRQHPTVVGSPAHAPDDPNLSGYDREYHSRIGLNPRRRTPLPARSPR